MADKESRKKQITARRREQILKAALEVFSNKGYAAATIPEIARQAGVAAGTIYLYYPSKRELFISVIRSFIITAPLLELIDQISEGDIPAIFKQVMQNRLDLINSGTATRILSVIGEVQRDPELKVLWAQNFIQPFLSQLEAGYRMMAVSGKFRRLEPAVAVRAVGGAILGFIMLKVMEGELSPLNQLPQEKVAEELVNFVLHGLMNEKGEDKQEDTA